MSTIYLLEKLSFSHQELYGSVPDNIILGKSSIFSLLEELHRSERSNWIAERFKFKDIQMILVDAELQVRNWQYVGFNYLLPVTGQQVDKANLKTANEGLIYTKELLATASCHYSNAQSKHITGFTIQNGVVNRFSNILSKYQTVKETVTI